jgi:hypothetical protein
MVFVSQLRPRLFEDDDNLYASCKPILDALVAWKLIKTDSRKHIVLRPAQNRAKTKITVVVIEPAANYETAEEE